MQDSDKGTPQGGLISPVLANVYLHYVLDLWFEKAVKPKLRGYATYIRYADDFLILFENRDEAERVLEAIRVRMEKFSLELAEEKTKGEDEDSPVRAVQGYERELRFPRIHLLQWQDT